MTKGYTLIEILVGLTIIGLLFAIGYVNFRDFSRRQAVIGAGKILQGDIRLAQQQALSGQKPDDPKCNDPNTLDGYFFDVISGSEYKIYASCTGGNVGTPTKDVIIPFNITISKPVPDPILFKVLGSGTNIPAGGFATIKLTQTNTTNIYQLTIGAGGEIQ